MGRVSKVIRIFISSPFQRGYQELRDALAEEVFPHIRALCQEHGLTFQPVDLRWGVSEVESKEHLTMRICLEEIQRCREQSPDLNFLVLAGGHYGTSFAPAEIPADDWARIARNGELTPEDLQFLVDCYQRDFNANGGPYCLRTFPKDQRQDCETRIREILFPAAKRAIPREEDRIRYGASATEQEIQEGLFEPAKGPRNAEKQAVVALRRLPKFFLPEQDIRSDSLVHALDQDMDLCHRIRSFLERRGAAPAISFELPATPETGSRMEREKDACLREIEARLTRAVLRRARAIETEARLYTPFQLERRAAAENLRRTAEAYLDMGGALDAFNGFLKGHPGKAVLVTGKQGSGKTTLLKTWAFRHHAVSVFGDVQPSRHTMGQILGYVSWELRRRGLLPSGHDAEYISLEIFGNLLFRRKQPDADPVVVVIDSVEQILDYWQQSGSLFRLRLPSWLTLVVSCSDTHHLTWEERQLDIPVFSLLPFQSREAGEAMLAQLTARERRTLTDGQRYLARVCLPEHPVPLYLTILSAILCSSKSYDPLPGKLADLPSGTREMVIFYLRQLEYPAAPCFYWHTLGFLAISSDGLTEEELLNLLETDSRVRNALLSADRGPAENRQGRERRFPQMLRAHWARLRSLLGGLVLEQEEQGVPLLSFRHDLMRDAALALSGQETSDGAGNQLGLLADHMRGCFTALPPYLQTGNPVRVNWRRVRVLYPVLRFLGRYDLAADILADPQFLDAYIRLGEYRRLRSDLFEILSHIKNAPHLLRIQDLLISNEALLLDCPESFLSVYVREYPETASRLLPPIGQSVWLDIRSPDRKADAGLASMFIPRAYVGEAALHNSGLIAVLLDGRIRLYDWNTRSDTGVEQILPRRDPGSFFLYWEGEDLIVRFSASRIRLRYREGGLYPVSAVNCRELPMLNSYDQEGIELAGGLRECEERWYSSEMVFSYRVGEEVRRTELFYPLGTDLRIYRHESLAAVLADNAYVDLLDLERYVHLRRLHITSAVCARFSPNGEHVLIVRDDSTVYRCEVPRSGGTALPRPAMSIKQYTRIYNRKSFLDGVYALGALFSPTRGGQLPYVPPGRNAFLGTYAPIFACMSKEWDWLACYYYYRGIGLLRRSRLTTGELLEENRVPPLFPEDAASYPLRRVDGENALSLTVGGVQHIWHPDTQPDTGRWIWEKAAEADPSDSTGLGIRVKTSGKPAPQFRRVPFGSWLVLAATCFILPEAWNQNQKLLDSNYQPPKHAPILLRDGGYVWEIDRNLRRVCLRQQDGTILCRTQLDRAILAADVWNHTLYLLPENSGGLESELMEIAPQLAVPDRHL